MSINRSPWWLILIVVIVLVVFGYLAVMGSFRQKSVERIIQFGRDFDALKEQRKTAANFLLSREGKETDVDDVLDFFDTPLGFLTESGYLDERHVYNRFWEWIRGYWSSCRPYIDSQTDQTKWANFRSLYFTISKIHSKETGSDKVLLLEGDELVEFLSGEIE